MLLSCELIQRNTRRPTVSQTNCLILSCTTVLLHVSISHTQWSNKHVHQHTLWIDARIHECSETEIRNYKHGKKRFVNNDSNAIVFKDIWTSKTTIQLDYNSICNTYSLHCNKSQSHQKLTAYSTSIPLVCRVLTIPPVIAHSQFLHL